MGQTLSQQRQSNPLDVKSFLLKNKPNLQNPKYLGGNGLFKTVLVHNDLDSQPWICKIFSKSILPEENKSLYDRHFNTYIDLQKLWKNQKENPNILPFLQIEDNVTEKFGLIIRQFLPYNLKERMNSMPYISNLEKKWICFQILYAVTQLHNKGKCHGDIKWDNILLTSNWSVFISDISVYKPSYIKSDDISTYTYFFINNTDNIKSCYLAPERIVEEISMNQFNNYELKPEMDVFSWGVWITEIFWEDPLFTHSNWIAFKKNRFDWRTKLKELKYPELEKLWFNMMNKDVNQRISWANALKYFSKEITPSPIPQFILHINIMIINYKYWKGDYLAALIYYHWKQIWKCLFGVDSPIPSIESKLNRRVEIKIKNMIPIYKVCVENFPLVLIDYDNNSDIDETLITNASPNSPNSANQCAVWIINYWLNILNSVKYNSSLLLAVEMIEAISSKVDDNLKIELIVPYLVSLFKLESTWIQAKSITSVLNILSSVNTETLILKPSDYSFFMYIFKSVLFLFTSADISVRCTIWKYLPKIIKLEEEFLYIGIRSRYANEYLSKQNNKNNVANISYCNSSVNWSASSICYARNSMFPVNKVDTSEYVHIYRNELNDFKVNLYKLIKDIFIMDDTDFELQLILVRHLPVIILFYSNKEINNFITFWIKSLNKNHIEIKKEIIRIIPSIVLINGTTVISNYFLDCVDIILNRNAHEIIIYELVRSIFILAKMEFISAHKTIELYKKIFVFINHPNQHIRRELIQFGDYLVNSLSQCEMYSFLWKELKVYLNQTFIGNITSALFEKCDVWYVHRAVFNWYEYKTKRGWISDNVIEYIKLLKSKNMYTQNKNHSKSKDCCLFEMDTKFRNISDIVMIVYNKEIRKRKLMAEDIDDYQKSFCENLLWQDESMYMNNIKDSKFEYLFYVLKAWKISIDKGKGLKDRSLTTNIVNLKETNYSWNESLNTSKAQDVKWEKSWNLLSTDYWDILNPPVKILELSKSLDYSETGKKILTVSTNGEINLYDFISNEYSVYMENTLSFPTNSGTLHKSNITITHPGRDPTWWISSKNVLKNIDLNTLTTTEIQGCDSQNNLTEFLALSEFNQTNNSILIVNNHHELLNYDPRESKVNTVCKYNAEYNIITAISPYNAHSQCLLGTKNGDWWLYDHRWQYIPFVFSFSNNDKYSVTNILPFTPVSAKCWNLYSVNWDIGNWSSYYFISTNEPGHNLYLINLSTWNCDLMMKINSMSKSNIKQLYIEIPFIKRTTLEPFSYYTTKPIHLKKNQITKCVTMRMKAKGQLFRV